MKVLEDRCEIDAAGTDQHLLAQLHGVGGPLAVFRMDTLHVRADHRDRIDRIGFPIENQVRRIQPHAQIWPVHILDRPLHRRGRFLPGLHQKVLSIRRTVVRNRTNRFDRLAIERITRILGDKAAMRLHAWNPQHLGEIRRLLQRVDPRCPRCRRHKTNRRRPIQKVPHQASRPHDLSAGCGHLILFEQCAQFLRQRFAELANVSIEREETGGQAQLLYSRNGSLCA